jgi:hypothetical protein
VADDPRIAAASPGDPARFGWRGIVGLLLAIGGGLVLVRAARG